MVVTSEYPDWALRCINKYKADAVNVIVDILRSGLKNSEITAECVKHRDFDEPRVIGCVFKMVMNNCGFQKLTVKTPGGRIGFIKVPGDSDRCHGRDLQVWRLIDQYKAESILNRILGLTIEQRLQRTIHNGCIVLQNQQKGTNEKSIYKWAYDRDARS